MPDHAPLDIRNATATDVGLLVDFIRELAIIEEFPYPVTVTEDDLLENLFGVRPAAEALIGYSGDQPACFAVYYETFSTTTGRRGLHLDDLFVRSAFQGAGYGKAMLMRLAHIATVRHCARFEWWTLRTNDQALRFFQSMGAHRLDELVIHRMQGPEIPRFAER